MRGSPPSGGSSAPPGVLHEGGAWVRKAVFEESRLFEAGAAVNDKYVPPCSLWNVAARSVGSDRPSIVRSRRSAITRSRDLPLPLLAVHPSGGRRKVRVRESSSAQVRAAADVRYVNLRRPRPRRPID